MFNGCACDANHAGNPQPDRMPAGRLATGLGGTVVGCTETTWSGSAGPVTGWTVTTREPLDVPALAAEALMSVGHFHRSFREAYGETPVRTPHDPTRRAGRGAAAAGRPVASPTSAWPWAAPRSARSAPGSPSSWVGRRATTARGRTRAPRHPGLCGQAGRPAARARVGQDRRSARRWPVPNLDGMDTHHQHRHEPPPRTRHRVARRRQLFPRRRRPRQGADLLPRRARLHRHQGRQHGRVPLAQRRDADPARARDHHPVGRGRARHAATRTAPRWTPCSPRGC